MDSSREKLYRNLAGKIGNTPVLEYPGPHPNHNKIFLKLECENPYGSHYDRVCLNLFRHHEEMGNINPGCKVLETTSGSAGVSFAAIGRELGYQCYVAIPSGGEKARENAISSYLSSDEQLILTPKDEYVNGFPIFLKEFLPQNRDYFFLNHSMGKHGTCNKITLDALSTIGKELPKQVGWVNIFVPAIGNGSSVLGPYQSLLLTEFIGFETFQSATTFNQLHPGLYQKLFNITPGTLSRHKLPRTSYNGIDFPHIRTAIEEKILHSVFLVSDKETDEEYQQVTGQNIDTIITEHNRTSRELLPFVHWDQIDPFLNTYGRSAKAGVAVAKWLSNYWAHSNKNIVVIAYDKADRYDS